jgi:serine/threonine protein kinase
MGNPGIKSAESHKAAGGMHLKAGDLVDEKYRIVGTLGAGGMGTLYHAVQTALERDIALKLISHEMSTQPGAYKRFDREALALSSMQHRNIVAFLGYGIWQSSCYLAMELIHGRSLQEDLSEDRLLPVRDVLSTFIAICDGLAYAHSKGIIHRDLKPGNIMMMQEANTEIAKIIDFGLAGFMPEFGKDLGKLTETGIAIGSVQYMSPEQCVGKNLDQTTDIYAVGCMLFHCLTGRAPFDDLHSMALMYAHLNNVPPRLSEVRTDVEFPQGLQSILDKAMAKNSEDRFTDANSLKSALTSVLENRPQQLTENIQLRPLERRPRASAFKSIISVLMISGLALFVFWWLSKFGSDRPGPSESESLKVQTNNAVYYLHEAEIALARHEVERAIEALKTTLKLAQQQGKMQLVALAQLQLGMVLQRTGKPREAIPLLLQALESTEIDSIPVEHSSGIDSLAGAYFKLGNWEKSIEWSQKRIDFETSRNSTSEALSASANSLASACMQLKRYERACNAFVMAARYAHTPQLLRSTVKGFFESLPLSQLSDHQKNKVEAQFLTAVLQSASVAISLRESSDITEKHLMKQFNSKGHGALSDWSSEERDYWIKECSRYYYRAAALWQAEGDRRRADEMFRQTIDFRRAHRIPEDGEIAQCLEIIAWNNIPDGNLREAARCLRQAIELRRADYNRYRTSPKILEAAAYSKMTIERDSKKLREVQQLCQKSAVR